MDGNRGKREATSPGDEVARAALNDKLRVIRRYWWVVALVVLVTLGSAIWSAAQTATSFTARSSLIVSSNNRSPDQDAVLVQGYVAYFNDVAYQGTLLAQAHVDSGVKVTAHAAAASPILLIQATAASSQYARTATTAVARTFQTDINRVRGNENETKIASLRAQLSALNGAMRNGALASNIQDQIQGLQSDQVNMLQELQFDGGVTENSPSIAKNALLGLVGGLLLGLVAALGTGRLLELSRSLDGTVGAPAAAGRHSAVTTLQARREQRERRERRRDGRVEAPPLRKRARP